MRWRFLRARRLRRPTAIDVGILAAILAAIALGPCRPFADEPAAPRAPVEGSGVVRIDCVLDGDTVVDGEGRTIRILSIDAPEAGMPFANRAAQVLEELVAGKQIRLDFDVERFDRYDRLLAHVVAIDGPAASNGPPGRGRLIGEELVRRGLAALYLVAPNLMYRERYAAAQAAAVDDGAGIWSVPVDLEQRYVVGAYRFHRPSCPHVGEIPRPRILRDRWEALKAGRGPCRQCRP